MLLEKEDVDATINMIHSTDSTNGSGFPFLRQGYKATYILMADLLPFIESGERSSPRCFSNHCLSSPHWIQQEVFTPEAIAPLIEAGILLPALPMDLSILSQV